MQTLTQLADSQNGRGPYGVDADYFHRQLPRIILGLENFRPAELAREFARLAITADAVAARDELLPATEQNGNSRDAVLGMAAQMALDYIARIHGAPPRNDLELESAYVALSLWRALEPYMSASGKERNRQTYDAIRAANNTGRSIETQPTPTVTEPSREAVDEMWAVHFDGHGTPYRSGFVTPWKLYKGKNAAQDEVDSLSDLPGKYEARKVFIYTNQQPAPAVPNRWRMAIESVLYAMTFNPHCQEGVVAMCACRPCADHRMRTLLNDMPLPDVDSLPRYKSTTLRGGISDMVPHKEGRFVQLDDVRAMLAATPQPKKGGE
ncbi:hypothetical protein ABH313_18315 [Chromobacterium vaccinii]|uniref:hypothetical protein n=1 Tax=Chromobacterium vaccinii TaxID=1108595 RepID=UPI0032600B48